MKIKTVKYKAGSILLWKRQCPLLKRLWYWILRKKRPYDKFSVLVENGDYLKLASAKVDEYILEPKKTYSKEEIKKLNTLHDSIQTVEDLITAINAIRPNTVVEGNIDSPDKLIQGLNKYYKVRHLLDEQEYTDYILPVE